MLLIGSRIQEYRKKAGLNQEEFAEKMGVSRQAVSKWERDKAYPDLDRLVCICEILDVQVGELIYGKGDEPEAPEEVSGDGTSANNAVHLKNLRGKDRLARLKILFCVMAAICVFCVIVVAVLFVRNEWIRHSDKNGNVRVEIADVVANEKNININTLIILKKIYDKYEKDEILTVLVTQMVRMGMTGENCFEIYEKGVLRGLKITRLYEFYIASMPKKTAGPG